MAFFQADFFSQALNRSVRCGVLLPTDQSAYQERKEQEPLPTLYLLHGMTGSQSGWYGTESLWEISRNYRMAIVLPNGENSFYCNSSLTGNRYGDYIGEELVAFTRSSFPLSDKREETFIGGLSMGGFGAIVNGLRNPDTFGYITAFSSALNKRLILRSDEEEGLDYFTRAQYQSMFGLAAIDDFEGSDCDYEALAEKLAASGKEKPKIYMDCGTEDVSLYQANADFKDRLLSLGYEVTWDSRPGGHDGKFWSESFCKAAAYLPVEELELAPDSPSAARLTRMNAAMTRKMTE